MDAGTIGICVSSAVAIGLLLSGWIWDTRNTVGRLEADFTKQLAKTKESLDKEINRVSEELERTNTMIEPFWQTLCASLPGILKMHNSPDPLAAVLSGKASPEQVESLTKRLYNELEVAKENDPSRAVALLLAIWAVKVKACRKGD